MCRGLATPDIEKRIENRQKQLWDTVHLFIVIKVSTEKQKVRKCLGENLSLYYFNDKLTIDLE